MGDAGGAVKAAGWLGGLRSPLAALLGYLELLEQDGLLDDPPRLREYLLIVQGRARELARVAAELLAFSERVAGREGGGSGIGRHWPEVVREVWGGEAPIQASAEALAAAVDPVELRLPLRLVLEHALVPGALGPASLVQAELDGERLVLRVVGPGRPAPGDAGRRWGEETRLPERARDALVLARRLVEGAGGALVLEDGPLPAVRLELPLREAAETRRARARRARAEAGDAATASALLEARALWQQASLAQAQALRAVEDMRKLRAESERERQARERAEAQQMAILRDFLAEHQRAVALAERLRGAYLETITVLARAVEARDSYTGGHVERVRRYSLSIAEALGMSGEALVHLEYGSVLHDVGKIGVEDAVLRKPGPLDPAEWESMKAHPAIGRRVLEGVIFLGPALDAVACHHERWDGRGYPSGLSGEAIPLAGRIVAVADAYDAMVTERPYRAGLPVEVALAEIERGRGTQFDPDLAAAFLRNPPPRA